MIKEEQQTKNFWMYFLQFLVNQKMIDYISSHLELGDALCVPLQTCVWDATKLVYIRFRCGTEQVATRVLKRIEYAQMFYNEVLKILTHALTTKCQHHCSNTPSILTSFHWYIPPSSREISLVYPLLIFFQRTHLIAPLSLVIEDDSTQYS